MGKNVFYCFEISWTKIYFHSEIRKIWAVNVASLQDIVLGALWSAWSCVFVSHSNKIVSGEGNSHMLAAGVSESSWCITNLAIAGIRNSKLCWWRMGHDLCDIHKQFGTDKILGPACESGQPANQDDESEHARCTC